MGWGGKRGVQAEASSPSLARLLDGVRSVGTILPKAREPCGAGGSGSSSNLHLSTPSSKRGAEELSQHRAPLRLLAEAPCCGRGCQTPGRAPRRTRLRASDSQAASAKHGRKKSAGRQAAKYRASGQQAGLGGFPDLRREDIGPPPRPRVPCSKRAGGGAGSRSHRAPRAAGAAAGQALPLLREYGDQLGHCRQLDATPGTKSRPTDRSGHRGESRLRQSVPQMPLRSLCWQSTVSPHLLAAALPGHPCQHS